MSIIDAIILGIIQGLTEFLPVSSSGHLELAKGLLHEDSLPKESLFITVLLHFATALATVVIFRKDIGDIFRGLFKGDKNQVAFTLKIIVSMVPAAVVGVAFNDQIESLFVHQYKLVGIMLLVTGVLLFLADRAKNTKKDVGYLSAVIIGISQAIAILPGISRSGATISTSVLLGIDRASASKFSFLMVVPLIFAKMAKDTLDFMSEGESVTMASDDYLPLALGFLAAFVTGLAACKAMLYLVKKAQLSYFSIYCFIVGFIALFLIS